ncbi:4-hydroxythreonine-4-phosphate dehydrogenase [Thiomonas arsenitoxydans]|uniref:4-hydroxythreonine-4-phosphate dehydrogenase n=1 Tax=Thiomonas arsenitoxydans (strain DSM 22701 / CIP 110005 / 3As) TaxID=426114 RepID=A0ABP1Z0H9_THIA3|nr:4-hydroxythreonine-4-phosphate dehydrogenase PdxA [Thiomonas arsenitoxydans]CQR26650.1 4-hydroxythreonine-4-phosphate dehydrogenase [Thiomonas arsenitoxydans]CQR27402.1 4-hydroxythreonine-4-phosphate dehydrogenase [Thiomonas arsenitoxydans]CQR31026.1 4-hydroxythreonine-4-phosphate dehydrogenase [Thiomonas arsenitoxydans]CQR31027.1 4-hydroxythreonine-4-phosphate dehydrogenase [Thiomonas arsenitoxydans]
MSSSTLTTPPESAPSRPIALTMGDPCGIGPETLVRAFAQGESNGCVVYGDAAWLARTARTLRFSPDSSRPAIVELDELADWKKVPRGAIPVLPIVALPADLAIGQVDARAGAAAYACIEAAARDALVGRVAAVVTAPIHKAALHAAGVNFPGHTEILQHMAGGVPVRMMLANEQLKTVLVTVHMALRQAIDAVTSEAVLQTLRIAHQAARGWGLAQPRIAVAGLNPHAGESGLFGDEEERIIAPAIAQARSEGIAASGPYPPDTVFMRARHALPEHPGAFDIVVAMYHDQGLIPVKYLGVEQGVNVTLGLPFVRTSPDHGTAFDIAGRDQADPSSLIAAIRMARDLAVLH